MRHGKKKMYLVKREVMAINLKRAMSEKGIIYSIELAEDKFQPDATKKIGFKN